MVSTSSRRVLISAGELSGDMHAATLVQKVKLLAPNVVFYGMGGEILCNAGVNIIVDSKSLNIMGGLGIITKAIKLWHAFTVMKRVILHDKPDLLLLVDYPGFNLRLAKIAKKAGIKVLYFISPKVWAWHQSRVKTIKECVTLMAVIFPFEVDFYRRWQVPVEFVGNPLLQMVKLQPGVAMARDLCNVTPGGKVIGLFPGSRPSEIKRLLPIMLKAAEILYTHDSRLQFFLAHAPSLTVDELIKHLHLSKVPVHIVTGKNYALMQACDAIIAASGTVTLEIALAATPLVIIYKMSRLEYQIAKRLIKIPYVGLCNILSHKMIAKELLQNDASPENIVCEINKILTDDTYRRNMVTDFENIKNILTSKESTDLAELVINLCHQK